MGQRSRRRRLAAGWAAAAALCVTAAGCGFETQDPDADVAPVVPATAKLERYQTLREFQQRPRHSADASGRAWIERDPGQLPHAVSATPDRFTIVFEVGPEGIAEGGSIHFQLPAIGGWSIPQIDRPEARGYTTVSTTAAGVELRVQSLPESRSITIRPGRALSAGDRVRIVYGAGPGFALADRYAETGSRFWIAVDGDGDGYHGYLDDSPTIDVHPGRAAILLVTAPSTARPGDRVTLRIAVLDAHRNTGPRIQGDIALRSMPPGLAVPASVSLGADDGGVVAVEVTASTPGVYRVEASAGPLHARSNPLVVDADGERILWGDLHGHSALSDGTGTADAYFTYARDVAGLDVVALTDHDHLGVQLIDERPERWQHIQERTAAFHEPGRFVTLLGYEWTNWIHGHRHVLFFTDTGPLLSAMDPDYETPQLLWRALDGHSALTFAHHTAGGPVATNWAIPPDPRFEPVTEIASVHGSSEAPDAPVVIRNAVEGNFVRDVLAQRGYRLGFVGSGDTHDGHPGVTHVGYASGGLAAIFSEDLTREGVLAALRARRVYATSGPRIHLDVRWSDGTGVWPMGAAVAARTGELRVRAVGTAPIDRIDVIRGPAVIEQVSGDGGEALDATVAIPAPAAGEFVYVRVVQTDGGAAWSSPVYFEAAES